MEKIHSEKNQCGNKWVLLPSESWDWLQHSCDHYQEKRIGWWMDGWNLKNKVEIYFVLIRDIYIFILLCPFWASIFLAPFTVCFYVFLLAISRHVRKVQVLRSNGPIQALFYCSVYQWLILMYTFKIRYLQSLGLIPRSIWDSTSKSIECARLTLDEKKHTNAKTQWKQMF